MREVTKYGKTVEEAVSFALEELNATEEEVEIQVIDQPRSGFLGIGARRALVRVTLKKTAFDSGREYLEDLIDKMGLTANIQVKDRNSRLCHCQFTGKDAAKLIGKQGQTLNALQFLANLVVNKQSDHRMKLEIDAENYRETRKAQLSGIAHRMADKVAESGRSYRFQAMPAFERKIIHAALAGDHQVETSSFGEEPRRHVTISRRKPASKN
ncbi:MAG: RNA-binding cell elongation regulator Jag/EloR [Sporolactobacillus sp.]